MKLVSVADRIVFSSIKNFEYGQINLKNYDGKEYKLGNENSPLKANLIINKPGVTLNILNKGSIGLAESYMRGEFETDNLTNLIEITAKNIKKVHKFSGVLDLPLINFFKCFFIKNTKKRSKENISKHYDLGNEFFSLWLDKTLTYSSAIFDKDKTDLEAAQINKYKKLSFLVKPKTGDRMLEIGCGWGGFAEYVGKNYDIKLDCITISQKQYEYAKERIFKNGLNEKVNIKMAIQAITIDDSLYNRYKTKQDFIQKYIFPGGFLPCKKSLIKYANETNLNFNQCNSYGLHYSNTLMMWRDEFLKKWDNISKQGFDVTFKRMWNFYLSYCEAGFKSKNIDLIQFSLQNK